jgi:hypothetical protein
MLGKRGTRYVATCLLVLGALALAIPAATLAAGGGGSAGDNQYTDPFAHSHTGGTVTATLTATATTPTATSPATPAPTTTSAAPAATPTVSAPAPTATLATSPAGATPRTLPYTGFDGRLAGVLGVGLIAGGAALRRRTRAG